MSMSKEDISRVIEMAWEDHTPFEAIESQFGINESDCIALMRRELKSSSFRLWRKRVTGRVSKHAKLDGKPSIKHRAYGHHKLAGKSSPNSR